MSRSRVVPAEEALFGVLVRISVSVTFTTLSPVTLRQPNLNPLGETRGKRNWLLDEFSRVTAPAGWQPECDRLPCTQL